MSLNVLGQNNINKYNNNIINTSDNNKNLIKNKQTIQRSEQFADKSNNGEFDVSEAAKNFSLGFVSPITTMLSSTKNLLGGVAMIAATSAAIAVTGGAAAPIFIATGIGFSLMQGTKALHKISQAKNGDDMEKAFFDMGASTSSLGLSAIGAKAALKQANINTKGLNTISSMHKCLINSKDLAIESFNVIKSGYYKTNLSNAVKILSQPSILMKYAKELHEKGNVEFSQTFNALKKIFPNNIQKQLIGRNKSQISIFEKMVKERTTEIEKRLKSIENIKDINIKQKKIDEIMLRKSSIATKPNFAKSLVSDRYGARLILDDLTQMDGVVDSLFQAARRGDIKITEIENYKGYNQKFSAEADFYFNQAQMNKLISTNPKMDAANKLKPSGYCAVQIKVKPKNCEVMELQIRGKQVNDFAEIEHYPYDLRQNKDIANGNNQIGIKTSSIKNVIQKMSKEDYAKYQKYIYENYMYSQSKEMGKACVKPTLPEGIDKALSTENLKALHDSASKYKQYTVRNPLEIKPQLATIAIIQKNSQDEN